MTIKNWKPISILKNKLKQGNLTIGVSLIPGAVIEYGWGNRYGKILYIVNQPSSGFHLDYHTAKKDCSTGTYSKKEDAYEGALRYMASHSS